MVYNNRHSAGAQGATGAQGQGLGNGRPSVPSELDIDHFWCIKCKLQDDICAMVANGNQI